MEKTQLCLFFRLVIMKRNVEDGEGAWIKLPIKLDREVICDLQSRYLFFFFES